MSKYVYVATKVESVNVRVANASYRREETTMVFATMDESVADEWCDTMTEENTDEAIEFFVDQVPLR